MEALALVGGEMYRTVGTRMKSSRGGDVMWSYGVLRFLLPDDDALPSNDAYGRPHVSPKYYGPDNGAFLEALQVRMGLVRVRFKFLLAELTSSPVPLEPYDRKRHARGHRESGQGISNNIESPLPQARPDRRHHL